MAEDEEQLPACAEKLAFNTRRDAEAAAALAAHRYGNQLVAYRCRECGLWHLSSR